jgi:N-acetylmuramoyl-L-alanine amidase
MKLRNIYILILAMLLLSLCIVMISSFSNLAVHTSAEPIEPLTTVIIDAGHGGEDGGAEAGGILEKDINLAIANRVADILRLSGCRVVEVRDTDLSVYSDGAATLKEKKTSDLMNRVSLFNSDSRNLVVSIHQNKFDNPKYSGAQVFYSVNHEKSRDLAESIRSAVVLLLQPENTRELKPAGKDIYILDHAEVPAVIVECGFLSNDAERQKLADSGYQSEMAFAVAMGVLDCCRQSSTQP